jgi:hypothetical protein
MFEALRQTWHKITDPFEGFLEVLWEVWKKDVVRATLMARQCWEDIPEETVQQSAAMQAKANAANALDQANRVTDQTTRINLESLGIPAGPSIGSGGLFASSVNPDQLLFLSIVGSIRAAKGDPPAMAGMEQLAAGVLRGQVDAVNAMVSCVPAVQRQQLVFALQAAQFMNLPQLLPMIRMVALIQAAIALPHDQIARWLPTAAVTS